MAVLVLDTEALSALARPDADRLRHQRVRVALRSAHDRNFPVRVPTADSTNRSTWYWPATSPKS